MIVISVKKNILFFDDVRNLPIKTLCAKSKERRSKCGEPVTRGHGSFECVSNYRDYFRSHITCTVGVESNSQFTSSVEV